MFINWIQKTTLVDYPGKVACTIFTAGCNLRCPFCHNPESVLPEEIEKFKNDKIPDNVFFNFLDKRVWILDGVVVCGWEPTLQSDLYDFIKIVKWKWFLVKLDTNGRDSKILGKLIDENLLDYVAIDFKQSLEKYDEITGGKANNDFMDNFKNCVEILKKWQIDYEFRTTVIKGFHTKEDIEKICKYLEWTKKFFLQKYRTGKTLDPDFMGESFNDKELEELKDIANKYVDFCGIRT